MNQTVLMSGADYFDDGFAINPYMDDKIPIDSDRAKAEHASIRQALEDAGVKVITVAPPKGCQDGVYTANWALCYNGTAIMSRLPGPRKLEEPYAQNVLTDLGFTVVPTPADLRFSGQGDALRCGNYLFTGSTYRTDNTVHAYLAKTLGLEVVSLQTIPKRRWHGFGPRVFNASSGWPDSFFYDIDLALAVLRPPNKGQKGLIAWCPAAFTRASRKLLREFDEVEKIEVSRSEAIHGFACNLVSTGQTVIMSDKAPHLQAELENRGFTTVTPPITELAKGGGYIRCTTLTIS